MYKHYVLMPEKIKGRHPKKIKLLPGYIMEMPLNYRDSLPQISSGDHKKGEARNSNLYLIYFSIPVPHKDMNKIYQIHPPDSIEV